MDGLQNLDRTFLRGRVPLFDFQVTTELALDVAGVAGCDQQIPCADAEVEITLRDFGKIDAKFLGLLFCAHDAGSCSSQ